MKQWEVWYAKFPYEEDASIEKIRPVIIINVETLECLSVKVTSHDVREADKYDTPIKYWKEAGLKRPSVARVSKTMRLSNEKFVNRKGVLHEEDRQIIMERFIEFVNSQN